MTNNPAKLSPLETAAGICIKILLGALYGYIYLHYYNGDDTWRHHAYSIRETELLLSDPLQFLINEYTPVHALADGAGWKQVVQLYLADLQYALFIKSFAILNLITQGNYYANMAVFNVVVFFGHLWLFKSLVSAYPGKRTMIYFGCFLFLPAVFWLSGLRIDGLLFFFVSLFTYAGSCLRGRRSNLLLLVAFAGAFICRVEIGALLLPAFVAVKLSGWRNMTPLRSFAATYILAFFIFFTSGWWLPGGGFPGSIAKTQQLFSQLEGTRFHLPKLSADPFSYLQALPSAIANTFLRPLPWEAKGFLQLAAAAEILVFWFLLLVAIIFRDRNWKKELAQPWLLFLLFFAISVYLSIGFVVPFPGAIIRYKAIALLLLVNLMLVLIRSQSNIRKT